MAAADKALDTAGLQRLWSHIQGGFGDLQAQINNLEVTGDYVPLTRTINGKALSSDITLTALEVGAMQYFSLGSDNDFNVLVSPGCYRIGANWINGPAESIDYGQVLVIYGGGDTLAQIAFRYSDSRAFMRAGVGYQTGDYTSTTWQPWVEILSSNCPLVIGSQNYGNQFPETAVEGQVYYKLVT